jgi:hypothetical protein
MKCFDRTTRWLLQSVISTNTNFSYLMPATANNLRQINKSSNFLIFLAF